jgi:hypothetical protein
MRRYKCFGSYSYLSMECQRCDVRDCCAGWTFEDEDAD